MQIKLNKKPIKSLSSKQPVDKDATRFIAGGTDCYSLGGAACPDLLMVK
ncbi:MULTISPECIES: hypothetical protein [Pseudoalteromonas]|uniref:Uncharacterized protein n=1 Tax=Pseudoalteromonas viridis TaxID=339617 RepID=A0ABX7V9L3_9GAMM|nr:MULTISPECIES: hypothetical protein [Pseudoalteromonas]QTL36452.1 hypothetical protein J5X90_05235 [Pseudoalteromonas viridis]